MDVVIVAQYARDIENLKKNNSRFTYIANLLSKKEIEVELVTSNFIHDNYKHVKNLIQPSNYMITTIEEPGYNRNISIKRVYSHFLLAIRIKKYLNKRKKPDCVYCAIPSLSVANMVANYCKRNKIKFIIDIQDLWPEAFKMIINIPFVNDIIFAPMVHKANKIYKQSDEIIAVSKLYCQKALEKNNKCSTIHPIYLGTNLDEFDMYKYKESPLDKETGEIWLVYCGTLSYSYDLNTVFKALKFLKENGEKTPVFVIIGDGVKKNEFQDIAKQMDVETIFTGRLPYPQMCSLLCKGDIVINPIIKSSPASIINKHADYAASALPVINTQVCKEYRDLVDEYKMGYNCESENYRDVASKIKILMNDTELRNKMGENARKCAIEKFDRKYTYTEIYDVICKVVKGETNKTL